MAVAANSNFKLALVGIRVAFLQSRTLDRDVFMLPPPDIRNQGIIWRLKKVLYGLDDASRKFWLRFKEVLKEIGLKVMEGDEAFYYLHQNGEFMGAVITHVDDFTLAGTKDFIKEVLETVGKELTVSKIERDRFRYTGIDVSAVNDGIEIEIDYVDILEEIEEIRKADRDEDLTKAELKVFRKMTGKLSWLANSKCPDLSYTALAMSKKNKSAQMKDLRDISRVLKKVKEKSSKMKFLRIGPKDDLIILGIGDASFKSDDKAVGRVLLFLYNISMTRATPIYWKSKTISRGCYSWKDAETINIAKMMEDAIFAAR